MGLESHNPPPENSFKPDLPSSPPKINSHVRGQKSEARVASVLKTLPDVDKLIVSKRNNENDSQMIDILVFLAPRNKVKEEPVKVQVKSGAKSMSHFRARSVKHRLRRQGIDSPENRNNFILQNRYVLINGGDVNVRRVETETGEKKIVKRPVTDEEIIVSFRTQVDSIRAYNKKNPRRRR